jgi:hypothetical protein
MAREAYEIAHKRLDYAQCSIAHFNGEVKKQTEVMTMLWDEIMKIISEPQLTKEPFPFVDKLK